MYKILGKVNLNWENNTVSTKVVLERSAIPSSELHVATAFDISSSKKYLGVYDKFKERLDKDADFLRVPEKVSVHRQWLKSSKIFNSANPIETDKNEMETIYNVREIEHTENVITRPSKIEIESVTHLNPITTDDIKRKTYKVVDVIKLNKLK